MLRLITPKFTPSSRPNGPLPIDALNLLERMGSDLVNRSHSVFILTKMEQASNIPGWRQKKA